MKALLLAAAMGLGTAAAMTGLLRGISGKHRFRSLAGLFGAGLASLVALHLATPDDLWMLPQDVLAAPAACDLAFAVFLYISGYWGSLLQLYNLAERGLSLRILIDMLDAEPRAMSAADIAKSYGAGHGLAWMYEKRLAGMRGLGLIERRGGDVAITPKGSRLARALGRAQAMLGPGRPEREAAEE